MEQAKRESDAKLYNEAMGKFQVNVDPATFAVDLARDLQARSTQLHETANRDPLFKNAVLKMSGQLRAPTTPQERDAMFKYQSMLKALQSEAADHARLKADEDAYVKGSTGPKGEEVYTPAYQKMRDTQLTGTEPGGAPEALKIANQTWWGRSKDISEHLQKDVRPIIHGAMNQSDEIVGLRRDLSKLKPGEPAWFHLAAKIKSVTLEKAMQTLKGIWDSDPALASAKAKGLTEKQYLENAEAFVTEQVDKTLTAEPYTKSQFDANLDIAKMKAGKEMDKGGWHSSVLHGTDESGNTVKYATMSTKGHRGDFNQHVKLNMQKGGIFSINDRMQKELFGEGNKFTSLPAVTGGGEVFYIGESGKPLTQDELDKGAKVMRKMPVRTYFVPDPKDALLKGRENDANITVKLGSDGELVAYEKSNDGKTVTKMGVVKMIPVYEETSGEEFSKIPEQSDINYGKEGSTYQQQRSTDPNYSAEKTFNLEVNVPREQGDLVIPTKLNIPPQKTSEGEGWVPGQQEVPKKGAETETNTKSFIKKKKQ